MANATINEVGFWTNISKGSMVTLNDFQTLAEQIGDKNAGVLKSTYEVTSCLKVDWDSPDGGVLGSFYFYELQGEEHNLVLMVKVIDDLFDVRVYFEPDTSEFETGDREDMIKNECLWLFQEPEDPEDFEYNELSYTLEIFRDMEGEEEPIVFTQKDPGEITGSAVYIPNKSGITEQIATIVEYNTDAELENPEVLVLEVGSIHSETGGYIRMLVGCNVAPSEVDVLKK